MDDEKPSEYDEASCLSKVLGCWLTSAVSDAASEEQTAENLIPFPKFCTDNNSRLNHHWRLETKKPSPSLFRATAKTFGCRLKLGVFMSTLSLGFTLATVEFQARIIDFIGDQ
jgi:hypothetical protein